MIRPMHAFYSYMHPPIVALTVSLFVPSAAVAEWPMFHGDAANSGVAAANATELDGEARFVWRFATGARVLSSPAMSDGAVFIGSIDGRVYALDAASGRLRWAVQTGGPVLSSPAVADGTVFIGSDDGHLYALNADDGKLRWRFHAGREIFSSPTVAGGTVYVGAHTGSLYALAAASGAEIWRTSLRGAVFGSPAAPTAASIPARATATSTPSTG